MKNQVTIKKDLYCKTVVEQVLCTYSSAKITIFILLHHSNVNKGKNHNFQINYTKTMDKIGTIPTTNHGIITQNEYNTYLCHICGNPWAQWTNFKKTPKFTYRRHLQMSNVYIPLTENGCS